MRAHFSVYLALTVVFSATTASAHDIKVLDICRSHDTSQLPRNIQSICKGLALRKNHVAVKDQLCQQLCREGMGGALCVCGGMPPALLSRNKDDEPFKLPDQLKLRYMLEKPVETPAKVLPPPGLKARLSDDGPDCVELCRAGIGGSLCDCSQLPPALNLE